MNKLNFITFSITSCLLLACSSTQFGYNSHGRVPNSLVTDNNISTMIKTESNNVQQITALKNTIYGLFFKQGIFAGQDNLGSADFKYQRWQVPLIIGSMIDVNRNYWVNFMIFYQI